MKRDHVHSRTLDLIFDLRDACVFILQVRFPKYIDQYYIGVYRLRETITEQKVRAEDKEGERKGEGGNESEKELKENKIQKHEPVIIGMAIHLQH